MVRVGSCTRICPNSNQSLTSSPYGLTPNPFLDILKPRRMSISLLVSRRLVCLIFPAFLLLHLRLCHIFLNQNRICLLLNRCFVPLRFCQISSFFLFLQKKQTLWSG